MRFSKALAIGAALVVLSACGGGSTAERPAYVPPPGDEGPGAAAPPVNESGGSSVSAMIGPAGGTLSLSNGARLRVPAGALDDTVEVILSTGSRSEAFNNRDYERPIGSTLQVHPALVAQPGHSFEVSAPAPPQLPSGFTEDDITLAYEVLDEHQRELGGRGTNVQTRWDYGDATVAGGRMSAELAELGGFRLQFLVSSDEDVAP